MKRIKAGIQGAMVTWGEALLAVLSQLSRALP